MIDNEIVQCPRDGQDMDPGSVFLDVQKEILHVWECPNCKQIWAKMHDSSMGENGLWPMIIRESLDV